MKEETSTVSNSLIWFGAAVSIAEILTGMSTAPLGFGRGLCAIAAGHLIGCVLLFLAGLIGARTRKSSMETAELSFGKNGAKFFAGLNVLQLVGWTAVMIISGAGAAGAVFGGINFYGWCIIIGGLIFLWVLAGIQNLSKINVIAMSALFILTLVLSFVIFRNKAVFGAEGEITFGGAVELSATMPLSWLPLISDYTKDAGRPFAATLASAVTYFITSIWMYVIGMGVCLFTGENDLAQVMVKSGLGIGALVIVILSTVTTTFLDVYSAGISSESISKKIKGKPAALIICLLGTFLALFVPMTEYESFLYFIGSVFAPMIAIQITDYFILKRECVTKNEGILNFVIWLLGFIIYRLFMRIDTPVGYTLPAMVSCGVICMIASAVKKGVKK